MVDLTPAGVVETLSSISKQIDRQAVQVEAADAEHVRLKAEYRLAFAEAFLTAEGAMDVRRYQAERATADLYYRVEAAEQVLRAAKESLRVLRDRLEVGRSLSSVMKLEWQG